MLNRRSTVRPGRRLVAEFSLSPIEQDILLLAVAPEIDLKYETLFAYLNNDITRKWPTFDLALRVRRCSRRAKNRGAPLPVAGSEALRQRIAATGQLGCRSALMARDGFCRGAASLPVSLRTPHRSIRAWRRLSSSGRRRSIGSGCRSHANFKNALYHFSRRCINSTITAGRWSFLSEPEGVGRASGGGSGVPGARHIVIAARRSRRVSVRPVKTPSQLITSAVVAAAVARRGTVSWRDSNLYSITNTSRFPIARRLMKLLTQAKGPVFILANPLRRGGNCWATQRAVCFRFDLPDYATRLRLWENAVATVDAEDCRRGVGGAGGSVCFDPGADFRRRSSRQCNSQYLSDRESSVALDAATLFDAARAQSDQSLGSLATKVKTTA